MTLITNQETFNTDDDSSLNIDDIKTYKNNTISVLDN